MADQTKLQMGLEEQIEGWSAELAEKGDWIEGYIGDETIRLMTTAALSVLLAVDEVQDWLKDNGYLED